MLYVDTGPLVDVEVVVVPAGEAQYENVIPVLTAVEQVNPGQHDAKNVVEARPATCSPVQDEIMLPDWQVVSVVAAVVLVTRVVEALVVDAGEVQTETVAPVVKIVEQIKPAQQPEYDVVLASPATCRPLHEERLTD